MKTEYVSLNFFIIVIVSILYYIGGRQSADIVNWLKKKTGPACVTLDSVDAAKAMIEKDEVVVIGFFKVINSLKNYSMPSS